MFTRSTRSIGKACARRWRRRSASNGASRCCSSRSIPAAEPQKAGVLPQDADAFLKNCRDAYGLEISGLMCIPPLDEAPARISRSPPKSRSATALKLLSMGMSADFATAIALGATHVARRQRDFRRADDSVSARVDSRTADAGRTRRHWRVRRCGAAVAPDAAALQAVLASGGSAGLRGRNRAAIRRLAPAARTASRLRRRSGGQAGACANCSNGDGVSSSDRRAVAHRRAAPALDHRVDQVAIHRPPLASCGAAGRFAVRPLVRGSSLKLSRVGSATPEPKANTSPRAKRRHEGQQICGRIGNRRADQRLVAVVRHPHDEQRRCIGR